MHMRDDEEEMRSGQGFRPAHAGDMGSRTWGGYPDWLSDWMIRAAFADTQSEFRMRVLGEFVCPDKKPPKPGWQSPGRSHTGPFR